MVKVTFLGTGCMQPTKQRNHSAVLMEFNKEKLLFDCGEGTQRQLRFAGLKPAKITRIFLTHFHGDHVFGVPGLLSAMGADQFEGKLQIYGPVGTKKYLRNLWKSFAAKHIVAHEIVEVRSGEVCKEDGWRVVAAPLKHSVICLGYRLEFDDTRKMDTEQIAKFGLNGPIVGELQRGKSVVADGKKIKPDDVSTVVFGKKIAFIMDTGLCAGISKLVKGVETLIIEGTVLDELKDHAKKSGHLTVRQAAEIATKLKVKKLIITHISQRYKEDTLILREARKYFKGAKVAKDLMEIEV